MGCGSAITHSPSPTSQDTCPFLPYSCWAWKYGLLWPTGFGGSDKVPFQSLGLKGHGTFALAPRGKHALAATTCCPNFPYPSSSPGSQTQCTATSCFPRSDGTPPGLFPAQPPTPGTAKRLLSKDQQRGSGKPAVSRISHTCLFMSPGSGGVRI